MQNFPNFKDETIFNNQAFNFPNSSGADINEFDLNFLSEYLFDEDKQLNDGKPKSTAGKRKIESAKQSREAADVSDDDDNDYDGEMMQLAAVVLYPFLIIFIIVF